MAMNAFYRILQYIKAVEAIFSSVLLRFFVPISGAGYPGQRKFYTVMYYISCMWAWLGVINVWIVQRNIALWSERLYSGACAFIYILVSIFCLLPVDNASNSMCEIPAITSENSVKSLAALFTGMVFLLHAIFTTEMVSSNTEGDDTITPY